MNFFPNLASIQRVLVFQDNPPKVGILDALHHASEHPCAFPFICFWIGYDMRVRISECVTQTNDLDFIFPFFLDLDPVLHRLDDREIVPVWLDVPLEVRR